MSLVVLLPSAVTFEGPWFCPSLSQLCFKLCLALEQAQKLAPKVVSSFRIEESHPSAGSSSYTLFQPWRQSSLSVKICVWTLNSFDVSFFHRIKSCKQSANYVSSSEAVKIEYAFFQVVCTGFLAWCSLLSCFPSGSWEDPGLPRGSRAGAAVRVTALHPAAGVGPFPKHVLVGGGSDHSSSENVVSVCSVYCPLLIKTKLRWPAKINSLCVCSRGHHFLKSSGDSKDKWFFYIGMTVAALPTILASSGDFFSFRCRYFLQYASLNNSFNITGSLFFEA